MKRCVPLLVLLLLAHVVFAETQTASGSEAPAAGSDLTPDLRDVDTPLKLQRGDIVVVPIPISNPTLDTGLVLGGAYFYPQTEEQKKVQPASVTAVGAMYTSNESYAIGVGQQNYWDEDRWRFNGALGHADLELVLGADDASGVGRETNWLVRGDFLQTALARRVAGDWYLGALGRYVNVEQSIEFNSAASRINTAPEITSVGLGLELEFDQRDMPLNTYDGRYFEASALFNDPALGSDDAYQSYAMAFRSYHELSRPVVLAWELKACGRGGEVPLWDACLIGLRGFSATDYLGRSSASAQFEARWRMNDRWGLVGFAGGGYVNQSYSDHNERDIIPSYGLGLRYMVLKAKRINLRVDYARSTDSNAIHLSVGEAF
jgi:hypothetical protein